MTEVLSFATSDDHKFREVSFVLRGLGLSIERFESKGTEVQSDDLERIARIAAAETVRIARRPVIVEDTGLFIESLNGFPGPYANYVYRTFGPGRVVAMVGEVGSRSALFRSVIAYCDPGRRSKVFHGTLPGRISDRPQGSKGFGFDTIFIPRGERDTLAEMTLARKCELSHRAIAVRKFAGWVQTLTSSATFMSGTLTTALS